MANIFFGWKLKTQKESIKILFRALTHNLFQIICTSSTNYTAATTTSLSISIFTLLPNGALQGRKKTFHYFYSIWLFHPPPMQRQIEMRENRWISFVSNCKERRKKTGFYFSHFYCSFFGPDPHKRQQQLLYMLCVGKLSLFSCSHSASRTVIFPVVFFSSRSGNFHYFCVLRPWRNLCGIGWPHRSKWRLLSIA